MSQEKSAAEKSSYDPGWNDPPLFSYDSQQGPAKGYTLNKRVFYRIDDTHPDQNEEKKQDRSSLTSHPPVGPPPSISKVNAVENNIKSETQSDQEISLLIVLENFNKAIEDISDPAHEKEIRKRLAIMEKMWSEKKFPPAMQQKLHDISEGLQRNDPDDTCVSLQRSVMVDYTSLCSTWMPAVRLLINLKMLKSSAIFV